MKALRYGIGFTLAIGLAMTASCGGSTDGSDDAAGGASPGSSSGAGRSGGANASQGGRAPGTGSTNGGRGNTGPANNADCPAAAPAEASACTLTSQQTTCNYTSASCRCVRAVGGGVFPGGMAGGAAGGPNASREWQCTEILVCPATKPTVGDACTPASGTCPYAGMGSCSCSVQSSQWTCRGGGMTGAGGSANGVGGGFGFGGRFNGGGGTNAGFAGSATGSSCPATKPTADSACTGSEACPYTGGGCQCMSDKWACL